MIALLWATGMRISELLLLRQQDIDIASGTVSIRFSPKFGKPRVVGIAHMETLRVELGNWMAERSHLGIDPLAPLFCQITVNRRGRPIDSSYVRQLMRRLGVRAGITKRVHAHGFRHTHAAELLEGGMDLELIAQQLGHTSASTTAVYLRTTRQPRNLFDEMRKLNAA